jgi:hypothetical protein
MARNSELDTHREAQKPWHAPRLTVHGTIVELTQRFTLKAHGLGDDTFNIAVTTIR